MILKFVELTICFVTTFTSQDFKVLERGCINRGKSETSINLAGCLNKLFTWHHGFGQIVPKSLQCAGLDKLRFFGFIRIAHVRSLTNDRQRVWFEAADAAVGLRL